MGRAVGCALLLLWAVSFFLSADPRDQFAQETGLDPDLVNLIKVDVDGTELTITFVVINERTFQSKISLELSMLLQPYVGLNAIYVNPSIDTVVGSFAFDPQFISVQQSGVTSFLPWEVWDEITPGFLSGRFEVNPSGPSQGSGSEGVVILGDLIDPQLPFDVLYAGARASFEISSPSALAQRWLPWLKQLRVLRQRPSNRTIPLRSHLLRRLMRCKICFFMKISPPKRWRPCSNWIRSLFERSCLPREEMSSVCFSCVWKSPFAPVSSVPN